MRDMIRITFDFRHQTYGALITVSELDDHRQYRITVMNGDLERMLIGHNRVLEKDGKIDPLIAGLSGELRQLKVEIVTALMEYLHNYSHVVV